MLRGESQESFAVIQLHPPTLGYRSFVLVSVESKSADCRCVLSSNKNYNGMDSYCEVWLLNGLQALDDFEPAAAIGFDGPVFTDVFAFKHAA